MSLCAVGLPGCFEAPPEYFVPERIPPLLDGATAQPPIRELYTVTSANVDISIPFRVSPSEDDVQAIFLIDVGSGNPVTLDLDNASAAETLLTCKADWTNVDPGCHTITIRASYVGNFDGRELKDPNLGTEATWFASLHNGNDPFAPPPVDCFPMGPQ
jgi:hypothetical protein